MRKIISTLIIIISISIGIGLSSFANSNITKNESKDKKTKSTASIPPTIIPTPSASISPLESATPSPFIEIVPEYNCVVAEYNVFKQINEARKSAGLNPLEWSHELYRAAKIRASEIVTNESHYRPDGSSCFTVSKELARENIAFGYSSADLVYEGWINSNGHKENILAQDIHTGAIAVHQAQTRYKYYWVSAFGR